MNIGTIVTNVSVLIPQTVQNQRAGEESQTFLQKIDRDQPKLAALLKRRQKMNQDVEMVLRDFDTVSEIREDFANFITNLEDNPNVNLISQQINENALSCRMYRLSVSVSRLKRASCCGCVCVIAWCARSRR